LPALAHDQPEARGGYREAARMIPSRHQGGPRRVIVGAHKPHIRPHRGEWEMISITGSFWMRPDFELAAWLWPMLREILGFDRDPR
jgi:hypothetical protein